MSRYKGIALAISSLLLLFSNFFVDGIRVIRKSPEKGMNVCLVEREKAHISLERRVKSTVNDAVNDCGLMIGKNIDCEQRTLRTVISYVPKKNVTRERDFDCCPGWKNYKPDLGCFEFGSCLSLPQDTATHCASERKKNLALNQQIYRLNKPPKEPIESLNNPTDLQNVFIFPLMNMTFHEAIKLTIFNPFEQAWFLVYKYQLETIVDFLNATLRPETHLFDKFHNTNDFVKNYKLIRDLLAKGRKYKEYFRQPFVEGNFHDIMDCDHWKDDQVFVEQRLAGLNPMSLNKLTNEKGNSCGDTKVGVSLCDIKTKLNPNFDWDAAFSRAVGRKTTLEKVVGYGSAFVIHFPYFDDLSRTMDILDLNPTDARILKNSSSPIALFVSVKSPNTKSYQLKPVAIQIDSNTDSPVYQPHEGNKWLLAKEIYHVADFAYVEMVEHLMKTHMVLQSICVVAKRTLSEYHPLSRLLRWHCRGLFVTNTNGLPKLVKKEGYMHKLFSIGNVGSIELLNKAYRDVTWQNIDFWRNLKRRGVTDRKKLPYFPYRDDGILICKQIGSFVADYIGLYYRNNTVVTQDTELQNFANEISLSGTGENGGIGMLRGFPRQIRTKTLLSQTLRRILWLPVQHNAVNYPISYYGAFVPNMPTKLYDDPRAQPDEYSFHHLPDSHVATVQTAVSMSLGSLRFDKLLDYGSAMEDKNAAEILTTHREILVKRIKKIIDRRNEKRFKDGHLTYPYLSPEWIPNSIYT